MHNVGCLSGFGDSYTKGPRLEVENGVVIKLQTYMQIIVDDIDIEYQDTGSGPVVLLLHGWGGNAFSFNPLVRELNDKRFISLSFPGFGKSEAPANPWGVIDYAQFLSTFLKKLNISGIDIVVAHSFGGRVVIKAIAETMLFPKKLILIGAAGVSQKAFLQRCTSVAIKVGKIAIAIIPIPSIRRRLKNFARRAVGSDDYRNAGNLKDTLVKVVNEDLRSDASKIETPTLLIWGDQDQQTPLADARTLNNCIKHSYLKIIEGADHFVFVSETKRVAELINDFV